MKNPKKISSLLALIMAAFLFATFGIFTREVSKEIGIFYQLFARAGIMSLIFYIIGVFTIDKKVIKYSDYPILISRGILIVIDFSSIYLAFTNLPLGLTLFVFYAACLFSSYIYGYLFLNEKLDKLKITSLLVALTGLLLIYGESFTKFKFVPLLGAVLSGLSFGVSLGMSKKLTDKYTLAQVNLIAYIAALVLSLPLLIWNGELTRLNVSTPTWWWLGGFSFVGAASFYLTLYGYKYFEAQKASLVLLSEILFALMFGFVLYHEIPSFGAIVGGSLIIIAMIIPSLSSKVKID